jgi:hypothetical protein
LYPCWEGRCYGALARGEIRGRKTENPFRPVPARKISRPHPVAPFLHPLVHDSLSPALINRNPNARDRPRCKHTDKNSPFVTPSASAEQVFEQRGALTLLSQALSRLREEFAAAGKNQEFDQLKVFLSNPTSDGAYDTVAVKMGLPVDTIALRVHRLRQRYGELIRAEIAQTVAPPADIEEELQHLFNAVGR